MPARWRATWTFRCSTSTTSCSSGCAARPRANTSSTCSAASAPAFPGIALRTTFIVGFPGETEACFEALLDFIRETRFERLGVFTYSREDGTRAGRMAGQVPDKVKQQRRDLAMAAQHRGRPRVSATAFVGRTLKVLVEGKPADTRLSRTANRSVLGTRPDPRRPVSRRRKRTSRVTWSARGEADAPDIDGRVYVRGRLPAGEFARVKSSATPITI